MNLADIHRTYHPNSEEYTFSETYVTFFQYWPCTRTQGKSQKDKKVEVMPCILSDHNRLKLDINHNWTTKSLQIHGNWATYYWIKVGQDVKQEGN